MTIFLSFSGYESPTEEEQLRAIWNEVNVGATGFLDKNELSVVCDHIGMDSMNEQVCETRTVAGKSYELILKI